MLKQNLKTTFPERFNPIIQNPFLSVLVILSLTGLAFSNIFPNKFVLDDYSFIVDWPLIQNLANLPRFFIGYIPPEGQEGIYSPFKTLFHALNYQLFRDNPLGYHGVAFSIHAVGVLFVYWISLFLTQNRLVAFLTGIFFGLHPVHVEPITSMTASVDTLGIVFLLISFFYYLKAVGYEGTMVVKESMFSFTGPKIQERIGPLLLASLPSYKWSLFFAFLSVFTHELCISLPLLFLFYDFLFSGNKIKGRVLALRLMPFFFIVLFYIICKWLVLGSIARGAYLYGSFYLTMLLVIKSLAKYIGLMLLPLALTYNHLIAPGISSYEQRDFEESAVLSQSLLDPQTSLSLLAVLGILGLGIVIFKRNKLVSFCVGWFFICLLPVSHLIPSSVYFAERYLYPSSMTYCLVLSFLIVRLYETPLGPFKRIAKQFVLLLMITITVFYAIRTFLRNQDWRDQITIYESAVRANPKSAFLKNDLSIIYLQAGLFEKSLESFKEAIRLKPEESHFYFSMEEAYSQLKQYPQAMETLKTAIELNPQFAEGYFNLAGIHAFLEQDQQAREYLDKSIQLYRAQGRIIEAGESKAMLESYLTFERALKKGKILFLD